MDSDDEFETGLPKIQHNEAAAVCPVNLSELEAGSTLEFSFDAPVMVETDGHKKGRAQDTVVKALNPNNMQQMQLEFMTDEYDETLKVMFGDYSDIELLMTNVTTDGMLKKRVLRPGTGKKVMPRNMVVAHYMIGAEPMDDLMDSTYEGRRPKRFRVDAEEVIPAMDKGVLTMRVGEISKFLATSDYAFGKLGIPLMGGKILPPDSRVMLQMEVLETYVSEKDESILHMSSSERQALPFNKLFKYGEEMKNDGNREMRDGEFNRAIKCYLEALEAVRDMEPILSDEKYQYYKLRQAVCNNLAQAYFKLGKFKRALRYAEDGTTVPVNGALKAKSHYWYAKALYELGKYEQSWKQINEAFKLRPEGDGEINKLKCLVEEKLVAAKEKEKELCFRMMNVNCDK